MTHDVLKTQLLNELAGLERQLAEARGQINALQGAMAYCKHALELLEKPDPVKAVESAAVPVKEAA